MVTEAVANKPLLFHFLYPREAAGAKLYFFSLMPPENLQQTASTAEDFLLFYSKDLSAAVDIERKKNQSP